jgi:hypothetical protein
MKMTKFKKPKRVTPELIKAASVLKEAGISNKQMCEALNVSKSTVDWFRRAEYDFDNYKRMVADSKKKKTTKKAPAKQEGIKYTLTSATSDNSIIIELLEKINNNLALVEEHTQQLRTFEHNKQEWRNNRTNNKKWF